MDRHKAMRIADGEEIGNALPPDLASEVQSFQDLSALVREAAQPDGKPPEFEAFFRGVEARFEALQGAPVRRWARWRSWWQERPLWWMAPVGATLAAAALVALVGSEERAPNNTCFVDSYDLNDGSVVIDQDLDDPSRATVIWFLEEG